MIFNYRYSGSTAIASSAESVGMSFAPDTFRKPVYFLGTLGKRVPFREAVSALHDVVVSDLRYKPRDTSTYKAWAAQQESIWLGEAMATKGKLEEKIKGLSTELTALRRQSEQIMSPFYKARQRYYDYLYQKDRDTWFVLDPVITVHPDEIFFECFSQDEASYGRLGCSYEVFKKVNDFACGTTNIDYSASLYDEFQKIRDYKETEFNVESSGFTVQTTNEDAYKEVKIDLPDSWVRGFLQVSSAMTLPTVSFDLHPMDVHNLCFVLRRYKEKVGPRSMRYHLTPGEPVRIVFEPWNYEVKCPRSIFTGTEKHEFRVWGRRRLLILERLISVAKRFTVHLLGTGLPSFYVADLGDMNFTLGLSGWTANDWSRAGNFDLMAPRSETDEMSKQMIFNALQETWQEPLDSLSRRIGFDRKLVAGALSAYTQAGRMMYDLNKRVYRIRELSREPLPMSALRFSNPREEAASKFIAAKGVTIRAEQVQGGLKLTGTVKDDNSIYLPELVIDRDERIAQGKCTCSYYIRNKLFKGPCEHILALRIAHRQSVSV